MIEKPSAVAPPTGHGVAAMLRDEIARRGLARTVTAHFDEERDVIVVGPVGVHDRLREIHLPVHETSIESISDHLEALAARERGT